MFGYSRNSGISWFRDYGDAFHKYQSTTDIRGRTVEPKRPLGQRRSVDMYSIRLKDDGSMGVECVLYQTPVVTFYPNGLVELRCDGWASASTVCFIEEVIGHSISARIFNGSLCVSVRGIETRLADKEVLSIKDGQILNPTTDKTHKVDRAQANNVRKHYAEFVKYASALVRLKAGQFSMEEVESKEGVLNELNRPSYAKFPEHVRSLFALINEQGEDKHTAHYKATVMLARAYGSLSWGQGYKITGCHIDEKVFKDKFDALVLGYHRDEVFIEVDREVGVVKKDPYRKYYESGWRRLHETTEK